MSRYIDADGIDIRAREGYDHDGVLYLPYRDVRKSLDTAPSIDIIRCGECKWRNAKMMPKSVKCLFSGKADDYCSYGEREGE